MHVRLIRPDVDSQDGAGQAGGETLTLLQPPLPSVGVPAWTERGCQRYDRLADG